MAGGHRSPPLGDFAVSAAERRVDRGLVDACRAELGVLVHHDLLAGQHRQHGVPLDRSRHPGHRPHLAQAIAREKPRQRKGPAKIASLAGGIGLGAEFEDEDRPRTILWQLAEGPFDAALDLLIDEAGDRQRNVETQGCCWLACFGRLGFRRFGWLVVLGLRHRRWQQALQPMPPSRRADPLPQGHGRRSHQCRPSRQSPAANARAFHPPVSHIPHSTIPPRPAAGTFRTASRAWFDSSNYRPCQRRNETVGARS